MTPSSPGTDRVPIKATRLTGLVAGLALGTALLASCSSSPPTATGYFEELSGHLTDLSETVSARQADFGEELSDQLSELHASTDFADLSAMAAYFDQAGELAIVKTADLFSQTRSELRSMVDSLGDMEPPPELAVAHEDLITAGSDLVAATPAATETVRSLDSIDQLRESLDGSDFAAASQRFAIACTNLATAATSAGVAVELECPDLLAVTQVS